MACGRLFGSSSLFTNGGLLCSALHCVVVNTVDARSGRRCPIKESNVYIFYFVLHHEAEEYWIYNSSCQDPPLSDAILFLVRLHAAAHLHGRKLRNQRHDVRLQKQQLAWRRREQRKEIEKGNIGGAREGNLMITASNTYYLRLN